MTTKGIPQQWELEDFELIKETQKDLENGQRIRVVFGLTDDGHEYRIQSVKPLPKRPAEPPGANPVDDGWICWQQVIASFAIWMNTWGIVGSYGAFQTYYEVAMLSHKSPSQIAWIGTIQAFLLVFLGVLVGPIFDKGFFHTLNLIGNILVVFGLCMTSLCTEYWQLILAQGIVTGTGFGCLFIPGTALIPQYFQRRRSLASGLAACGSGIAGLLYPIIFRQLQPRIGFGWTVRFIALVALFCGILANVTACNRKPPVRKRAGFDKAFFRQPPLILLTISYMLVFMGAFVPQNYVGSYSLLFDITSEDMAFYLVSIIQASSVVGRILPSILADRWGPINIVIPSMLGAGTLCGAWIGIRDEGGLIVMSILYGICFGLVLSLAPVCVLSILGGDLSQFGTHLGLTMLLASPGVLIGNPISAAIYTSTGHFSGLQGFATVMLLMAGLMMLLSRTLAVGIGWVRI